MINNKIEQQEEEIWNNFLNNANSEDLFRSVLTVNYGDINYHAPLTKKILEDSSVDQAVVLAFYWRLAPRFKKQYLTINDVPEWQKDSYLLISELEERFLKQYYPNKAIYFNPKDDFGENWTIDYLEHDPSRRLPRLMEETIQGNIFIEEPFDIFDNGLPMDLAEKVFDLYD